MKRGTDQKLKFKKLKARLDWPVWQVKGLLQSLWDFTAENAPLGDIGRFPNEEIAFGIEYDGDAEALVSALVETHWLDSDPDHRLVVHDWHEHAEDWLKKRVQRAKKAFVSDSGGQRRTVADNGGPPSLAQPSQTKPKASAKPSAEGDEGPSVDEGGRAGERSALSEIGFTDDEAAALSGRYTPERIRGVVQWARSRSAADRRKIPDKRAVAGALRKRSRAEEMTDAGAAAALIDQRRRGPPESVGNVISRLVPTKGTS